MYKDRIETKDLVLRKGKMSEAGKMHENFWGQEETAQFMLWTTTQTVEDAEKRLENWLEYQKEHLHWFVYLKTTNEPIGFVSVEDMGNGKFGNLAACLGVDFKGKGYATQILTILFEYLRSLGAKEIEYSHLSGNIASQKLAEKFGFKFSYKEKRIRKRDNKEFDELFYSLDL